MRIKIRNGNIVIEVDEYNRETDMNFPIQNIWAKYGVDRENVLVIYRMMDMDLKSTAPSDINEEAKLLIWNNLCDLEYNDAGDSGSYRVIAKKDIMQFTGVTSDIIVIE